MPNNNSEPSFETLAIHFAQDSDSVTGAVVPAINLASTFAQDGVGNLRAGFDYSRSGNPTRATLESLVARLEQADHGYAFASGLAAEDCILRLLNPGDHLIIPDDAYGGTFRLISKVHARYGITYTPVDQSDPANVIAAWTPNTKMVWVETPTNPNLSIVDIAAISQVSADHNGICVVDNTFATPYLQQPLALGADLVIHSMTKYMGGHSDVVGGFVATSSADLGEAIGFVQNAAGAIPAPFDCYMLLRGIKTLAVRMERHCDNAETIADMLSNHPKVDSVLYPGLTSHPNHKVAAAQMKRFGGMISFIIKGSRQDALDVVERTKLFTLAESLGAVESLIEHPAQMTHASAAGSPLQVDDRLIRISVGIENVQDLVADLESALK